MRFGSISSGNYFVPLLIGAPDRFKNFYISRQLHNNNSEKKINSERKVNTELYSYLAGLWEGDGHIYIPNNKPELKKSYPHLAITFVNKDKPLVIILQEKFGGIIREKTKENAIVWIITSRKSLINIVNVLNGYIRTPKIYQFNKLISWINSNYNENLIENSIDTSALTDNNWFAGFFDADGGFKIRYTERILDDNSKVIRKGRIEVRLAIEQRQFHPITGVSYENIMRDIAKLITSDRNNLRTSKHNDKLYWIVEGFSLTKLNNIKIYLKKSPLLTSKHNDFQDWCIVYDMISRNEHLTDKGKQIIKSIKLGINKNRKIIDWNHLKYYFEDLNH